MFVGVYWFLNLFSVLVFVQYEIFSDGGVDKCL
jgi:hypothetical protein